MATTNVDIANVAEDYVKDIFISSNQVDPRPFFIDLESEVLANMKGRLRRPISLDEVKRKLLLVFTLRVLQEKIV